MVVHVDEEGVLSAPYLSFSLTLARFFRSLSLTNTWFTTSRVLSQLNILDGYSIPPPSPSSESLDLDLDSHEMVQKYGAVLTVAADATAGDSEQSALLAGDATPSVVQRDGHASMLSSVSNLTNTIMGSGMLTFPLAMASSGIIPGILTCIFSGCTGAFGLYLLSLTARYAPHRGSSFFAVAQLTFPQAAIFFDAAIAIKCFGVSISYLIIIKSLIPNVVESLYHDLTSPDTYPPAWALSGRNWITIIMLILVPLSSLRRLDSLRHTSYIVLFSVVYLVAIVIICYFNPLEVFAFTCAQNLFPIFNELKTNSQQRMNLVIGTSIGSAIMVYEVIALFGYLTFGSNVGANIIAMYPSTSLFIAIGQLAIVMLIMFSYPLQVQPCRNCLDKIFHVGAPTKVPGSNDNEEEVVDEAHAVSDMSLFKHTLLTAAITGIGFVIAYFVDDLQMVLSFVGTTGSTTISFILPGFLFWKISRDDPSASRTLNKAALALAGYGCCVFVFCSGYNIYRIFNPSEVSSH
ncbi:transmembrane amino acid transporter protein-domain-containing protein [Suillus paluster]|uniref:transmembrane amino acid transporter protein-domain-containing protein n=1 Tax=Suillus paluster TaxID=48578 RepID=UPI001B8727A5|nr:transmembrane amino acid transporter protein-domain-containing protein [Suillus paluster]KAG1746591.1 transmembrane amino acid transporter protein-domain-containing protein [Suillus paluster]